MGDSRGLGQIMDWYIEGLKKYAVFSGRARRREYWTFALLNVAIIFALDVFEWALGGPGALGALYTLAVLSPSLAVTVRRLHDTNRSGWWLLILVIPILGALVLIVFLLQDSDRLDNRFGPSPKYIVGYPELDIP